MNGRCDLKKTNLLEKTENLLSLKEGNIEDGGKEIHELEDEDFQR